MAENNQPLGASVGITSTATSAAGNAPAKAGRVGFAGSPSGDLLKEPTAASAGSGSRKGKGSTVTPDYGRRTMKYYPISKGELGELFGIGVLATVFFSLATGLFGFAVNISKDLSFNQALEKDLINHWENIEMLCYIVSLVFGIVGCLLVYFGHTKIAKIKEETDFGSK